MTHLFNMNNKEKYINYVVKDLVNKTDMSDMDIKYVSFPVIYI